MPILSLYSGQGFTSMIRKGRTEDSCTVLAIREKRIDWGGEGEGGWMDVHEEKTRAERAYKKGGWPCPSLAVHLSHFENTVRSLSKSLNAIGGMPEKEMLLLYALTPPSF